MTEPRINHLCNRDKASIDEIEASFRTGVLGEAMRRSPAIERRSHLSLDAFVEEYRKKQKPVVIEGLMDDWPALRKWSFDYLVEKCGDTPVVVDSYNSKAARQVTFAEFVGMLRAGRKEGAPPIYLQEWYYQANCPVLAEDLPELPIAQYDFRRNLYTEKISTNHQLWIGQEGATTRIHQDSYFIDVMHAQIIGEKHWCVMGPDAQLDRDAAGALDFAALVADPGTQLMHCVLRPGDVIYLPTQWWHRVQLLRDSVGLGRKCLDEVHLQKHVRMRLAELMALALNHEHVKAAHPELYKVVVMRTQTWAKLLDIDLNKLRP